MEALTVIRSACWPFRVGRDALTDLGRRCGESPSGCLDTEDVSVTKTMIDMMALSCSVLPKALWILHVAKMDSALLTASSGVLLQGKAAPC